MHKQGHTPGVTLHRGEGYCALNQSDIRGRWKAAKVAEGSLNWVFSRPVGKGRDDGIPDSDFRH